MVEEVSPPPIQLPPRVRNVQTAPWGEPPGMQQVLEDIHATQQGLLDYFKSSHASREKKEGKEKATSKWLPSGVFLVKLLSAERGWETFGTPATTPLFDQLVDMKITGATALVRSLASDQAWPGGMLKSGVSDFLKRGLMAEDIDVAPSGFSALFFYASSHTDHDSSDFGIQQLREIWGDGELPLELMKAYNKRLVFVPENTYQAVDQLRSAIAFLKCVLGKNNLAMGGYQLGLDTLVRHWKTSDNAMRKNKLFLVSFIYMLDRTFQFFCKEMLKYQGKEDPVQEARPSMKVWMEQIIGGVVQSWIYTGAIPNFALPEGLSGGSAVGREVDLNPTTGGGAGGGRRHSCGQGRRSAWAKRPGSSTWWRQAGSGESGDPALAQGAAIGRVRP